MSTILWTHNEVALLIEMLEDGQTTRDVSEAISRLAGMGAEGFPCLRSTKAVERKKDKLIADGDITDNTVDLKWISIRKAQDKYRSKSKWVSNGLTKNATTKLLVLSDIHFPFAREDYLKQAIEDHKDADACVLNGDILDGYAHSFFDKEQRVAAIDEYNIAHEFIYLVSRIFRRVFVIPGNHDDRAMRMVKKLMAPEAYEIFSPNLIARLVNGEKLKKDGTVETIRDFSNVYYSPIESWWLQIGKTLFIHPHSRGSAKPAYTVSAWAKKFKDRLAPGSFDSIICGHTHATSKHVENGILLIEQGCLCDAQAYSWQPREIYHSNASNGYGIIYQDKEGNTDFNKSTFVYLGSLLPQDKPIINTKELINGGKNEIS